MNDNGLIIYVILEENPLSYSQGNLTKGSEFVLSPWLKFQPQGYRVQYKTQLSLLCRAPMLLATFPNRF